MRRALRVFACTVRALNHITRSSIFSLAALLHCLALLLNRMQELELDHLPLALLLPAQLKVLRPLDRRLKGWLRIVSTTTIQLWPGSSTCTRCTPSSAPASSSSSPSSSGSALTGHQTPAASDHTCDYIFVRPKSNKDIWGSWFAPSYDNCCVLDIWPRL